MCLKLLISLQNKAVLSPAGGNFCSENEENSFLSKKFPKNWIFQNLHGSRLWANHAEKWEVFVVKKITEPIEKIKKIL